MTPRDADELSDLEYGVFWDVMMRHVRERERAERAARRRRG